MRKYFYLGHDIACIGIALVVAMYLRHGTPLIQPPGNPKDLYPLLLAMLGTALVVLPLMRTHTRVWRFTSTADLANIMLAVALVVILGNALLFLISRLDVVPRSVPPMQWALAAGAMGANRVLARKLFGPARAKNGQQSLLKQHVIIVGAGYTAEIYLQFVRRILQHPVIVEGLVDSDPALTHRMFHNHRILGTPAAIPGLIEELLVHGIHVQQIVLAKPLHELPEAERELLQTMAQQGNIDLVHFAQHIGPQLQPQSRTRDADFYEQAGASAAALSPSISGYYPYVKRAFDIAVGLALVVLCLPLMAITTLLVFYDVGHPVIFWQQRPGRYGKPFRLYKFRTMRSGPRKLDENRQQHKSADRTRTSLLGTWLRRLRLDELPQLLHIVSGTMSFVGPRPLLPDDQPKGGEMRLSVRPGVTGWAQIHGGDALTPEEKLVLDRWYIRHMSLALDVRILLRTLLVLSKDDTQHRAVAPSAAPTITEGSAKA